MSVLHERGNTARQQRPGRQEFAKRPHDRADVEQGADAGPRIVDDERTKLDWTGVHHFAIPAYFAFLVIVAQVAGLRAGAKIHPLAKVTVAEETIMALVGIALQDALLNLPGDATVGPNAASLDSAAENTAAAADVAWAL